MQMLLYPLAVAWLGIVIGVSILVVVHLLDKYNIAEDSHAFPFIMVTVVGSLLTRAAYFHYAGFPSG